MYLLEKFASGAGKKGGEFFSPKEVSSLLAKLLAPKEGDRIFDIEISPGDVASGRELSRAIGFCEGSGLCDDEDFRPSLVPVTVMVRVPSSVCGVPSSSVTV